MAPRRRVKRGIRRGMNQSPSIHASAVLVGARAVLIQGPSGSGKSRLALALLHAAAQGLIPFARLVTRWANSARSRADAADRASSMPPKC